MGVKIPGKVVFTCKRTSFSCWKNLINRTVKAPLKGQTDENLNFEAVSRLWVLKMTMKLFLCFYMLIHQISNKNSEYPLRVYIHPSLLNFSTVCPFKWLKFYIPTEKKVNPVLTPIKEKSDVVAMTEGQRGVTYTREGFLLADISLILTRYSSTSTLKLKLGGSDL